MGIRPSIPLAPVLLLLAGCTCFDSLTCEIDAAEVIGCRSTLEARYSGQPQKLNSALASLEREYNKFRNKQQSCDKFSVFLTNQMECSLK